jgi:hypothetical protein
VALAALDALRELRPLERRTRDRPEDARLVRDLLAERVAPPLVGEQQTADPPVPPDERQREDRLEPELAHERTACHGALGEVVLEEERTVAERAQEREGLVAERHLAALGGEPVVAEDDEAVALRHEHAHRIDPEERGRFRAHEPRDAERVGLEVDGRGEAGETGAYARGMLQILEHPRVVDQVRRLAPDAFQDAERRLVEAGRRADAHEDGAAGRRAERGEADRVLAERVEQLARLGVGRVVAGGVAEPARDELVPERDPRALATGAALAEPELLREAPDDVRRRAAVRHGHEAAGAGAVEVHGRPVARHELDRQTADAVDHGVQVERLHLQQRFRDTPLPLEVRDLRTRRVDGRRLGCLHWTRARNARLMPPRPRAVSPCRPGRRGGAGVKFVPLPPVVRRHDAGRVAPDCATCSPRTHEGRSSARAVVDDGPQLPRPPRGAHRAHLRDAGDPLPPRDRLARADTATAKTRAARMAGVVVLGAGIALYWLDYFLPAAGLGLGTAIGRLVAVVLVTALVTRHVLRREGTITIRRIQGAVAVYLLIGLTWAGMYEIIHDVWPGAFRFSEEVPRTRPELATSLAYFSFVTLTTMGYGDITPLHPVARSVAILEALVGQLFPAILIARLVALELAARERR